MTGSREYPVRPIAGVGAVIISAGELLLVRRNRPPLLGEWSIPGGAVELGETLEEAVIREVFEETGLIVTPAAMLKTFDRIERDPEGRVQYHYVLVDFLCTVTQYGAPVAATDVSEARWVPLAGLRQSEHYILPGWTLEVIELALPLLQPGSMHPRGD